MKKKCPLDGCDKRRTYTSDEYWEHLEKYHGDEIKYKLESYWEQAKSSLHEDVFDEEKEE